MTEKIIVQFTLFGFPRHLFYMGSHFYFVIITARGIQIECKFRSFTLISPSKGVETLLLKTYKGHFFKLHRIKYKERQ